MHVMVFYIDSQGKRRGWARGKESELDRVRVEARQRLDRWIAEQNEALGTAEWSAGDFEEFVGNVRETS